MTKKRKVTYSKYEGLSVVDANKPIILHITESDIKNSDKKSPGNCAAARAGKRELKKEVRVFLTRTYVKEKNHWVRYTNPESVTREIISFDRGSTFEPGEYKINPAPASERLGAYKVTGKKKHTGTPRQIHKVTAHVREFDKGKF